MALAPLRGLTPPGRSAAPANPREAAFAVRPFFGEAPGTSSPPVDAEELRARQEEAGRLGHDFARVGVDAPGPVRPSGAAVTWRPGGAAPAPSGPVVQRMERTTTATTSTSTKRERRRSRSRSRSPDPKRRPARSPSPPDREESASDRESASGEESSSGSERDARREKKRSSRKEEKRARKEEKRARKKEKRARKKEKRARREARAREAEEARVRERRAPYQEDYDEWVEKEREARRHSLKQDGYHSDEVDAEIDRDRERSRSELPPVLPDPVPRHSVTGVRPSNSNAPYGTTVTADDPRLYTELIREGWANVDARRRQATLYDNLLDPRGREKITYGWSAPHRENDDVSMYPVSGPRTLHISPGGTKALAELNSADTSDPSTLDPRNQALRSPKEWDEAVRARALVEKRREQEQARAERKERERKRREEDEARRREGGKGADPGAPRTT